MNLDLLTAIFLAISGLAVGLRQIVLSPHNETFPRAPSLVRASMFLLAMLFAGVSVLFFEAVPVPGDYGGQGAGAVAAVTGVLALYNAVMLVNLFTQRYRPEVWRRLNRATETVKRSCPTLRPQPLLHLVTGSAARRNAG